MNLCGLRRDRRCTKNSPTVFIIEAKASQRKKKIDADNGSSTRYQDVFKTGGDKIYRVNNNTVISLSPSLFLSPASYRRETRLGRLLLLDNIIFLPILFPRIPNIFVS